VTGVDSVLAAAPAEIGSAGAAGSVWCGCLAFTSASVLLDAFAV